MIATALVVGATVGVVATINWPAVEGQEPSAAVVSALTHDEFIRINTTDLERLPARVSVTGSPTVVHPFLYWNIDSFEGLVPAEGSSGSMDKVSYEFFERLEWPVYSLEYPPAERAVQPSGPR